MRIKLTKEQVQRLQENTSRKNVILSEAQFKRMFNVDDTFDVDSAMRDFKSDYKPQSDTEHKKTYDSFNEGEDPLTPMSYEDFGSKIKSVFKGLHKGSDKELETFANELKSSTAEMLSQMKDLGMFNVLTKDEIDYLRFKKDAIVGGVKTLYKHYVDKLRAIKLQGEMMDDMRFVQLGDDIEVIDEYQDPREENPEFNKPTEPKVSLFTVKYYNNEIAILSDAKGQDYVFDYTDIDPQEFLEYSDTEIVGHEQDPDDGSMSPEYGDINIDDETIERFVNANIESLSKGSGLDAYQSGSQFTLMTPDLSQEILDTYPSDASKIISVLNDIEEATGAASAGAYSGPAFMEEGEAPKLNMFSAESGKECKTEDNIADHNAKYGVTQLSETEEVIDGTDDEEEGEEVDEATGAASAGAYSTPKMWAKSKKDHVGSQTTMYKGGTFVSESREKAQIYVTLKKLGFEIGEDFAFDKKNFIARDFETAKDMVDAMADVYYAEMSDELPNGTVPVTFNKKVSPAKQGELQFPMDESVDKHLNKFNELKGKIETAKANGKNVAKAKADKNEFYYHVLDVILNDDSIQLKGGISNTEDGTPNTLHGSFQITNDNINKLGNSAFNLYSLVLNAADQGKVLDISDIKNPTILESENGKFVEMDDCTKLNNNKEAQEGGCSQGAVDGVVKTFESVCKQVAEETKRDINEVRQTLIENKLHEGFDMNDYYNYMWTEMGMGSRTADNLKDYLETREIDGDTYQEVYDTFKINDVDLHNILDILGL